MGYAMNQRFFLVRADRYETLRLALDEQRGRPTLEPISDARKASSGEVLLGVWDFHCEIPEHKAAITSMIENGWAQEISESAYYATLPAVLIMP